MVASDQVAIRPAELRDYTSTCRLMDTLDALHRERLPWMFTRPAEPPRSEGHFEGLLNSDDAVVFVAEVDAVVGLAVGFVRSTPDRAMFVRQRYGVLDSLVVDPAWRRRGIGQRLARSVQAWALEAGARWLEVNVYEANPEARRFYEALGYLPLSTKMRIGEAGSS